MGEQMAIELVKSQGIYMGCHRGDKRIVLWTKAYKKIRDKFEILEELAGNSQGVNNVLEALIIIGDRGTTYLDYGKPMVKVHDASKRLGGESVVDGDPQIVGGLATYNLGENLFR
jgi:hypothetical protein